MKNSPPAQSPGVERDPRLFIIFMMIVVAGIYTAILVNKSAARAPEIFVPVTILLVIHMFLHWRLEALTTSLARTAGYVIAQGLLALAISWLANTTGMTFALYMALIGECVGLFGLTRRGLLAGVYYVVLMAIALLRDSEFTSSGLYLVGIIPMVLFVVLYVAMYMRQLEAREQAQALAGELEKANRQLAEYAVQVEDLTIANERERIARELHDTLSQGLAGLILQLEAADAHLAGDRAERAQAIILHAMEQARATLSDARRAIDNLRQPYPGDLESAFHLETDRFSATTGIPAHLHIDQALPLSVGTVDTLVRILSEALSNIAKHAHARQVAVDLGMQDGLLSLAIQDDGRGFDPASVPAGHYGLLGIQERAHMLHGDYALESAPGKGTRLTIRFPAAFPDMGKEQREA